MLSNQLVLLLVCMTSVFPSLGMAQGHPKQSAELGGIANDSTARGMMASHAAASRGIASTTSGKAIVIPQGNLKDLASHASSGSCPKCNIPIKVQRR